MLCETADLLHSLLYFALYCLYFALEMCLERSGVGIRAEMNRGSVTKIWCVYDEWIKGRQPWNNVKSRRYVPAFVYLFNT